MYWVHWENSENFKKTGIFTLIIFKNINFIAFVM